MRAGLNYQFGNDALLGGRTSPKRRPRRTRTSSTFTARPLSLSKAIRRSARPIAGTNSLPGGGQGRETCGRHALCRRAAMAGRGTMDQPGDRPGVRARRYTRRRRVYPVAKPTRSAADYPYARVAARIHPPDHRSRRRDAEGRRRHQPVCREPDRQPAGHNGRQIQRRRYLRQQQICARSAQRFHELGGRRHRNVRLRRRRLGLYATAPPPSGTRATGPCAAGCSICRSSPTTSNSIRDFSNSNGSAKSSAATICGDIPARSRSLDFSAAAAWAASRMRSHWLRSPAAQPISPPSANIEAAAA